MRNVIGAIEAGGTKFVLAIGPSQTEIAARHEIPTRSPEATLAEAAHWFETQGPVDTLGIASFGPLELDPAAPGFGHITNTPKPGWAGCDIAGYFRDRLSIPVGIDTDVNGAAMAEAKWGAGRGGSSLAYITIGTGIGGGLVIRGEPVHGAGHPEMGHVYVRRAGPGDSFPGACPQHGACLEGLASGTAIRARWGAPLSDLPPDHDAHGIVAGYVAQLCHALFAIASVETVVLGGGVMKTPGLLERIVAHARDLDNGYLPGAGRRRICKPALGDNAGLIGAQMLAPTPARVDLPA